MSRHLARRVCFLIPVFFLLTGCMTVWSISVNQIPAQKDRRQKISASESSVVVLSVPFGADFVAETKERLIAKCPGGAIEGVLTKFQTTSYPFVSIPAVTMEGYCVRFGKKGRA